MLRLARLLVALLALECLGLAPAMAAVTATPAMLQTPKMGLSQFLQGTDSPLTYKSAYTAGSNGSKVTAILLANFDTTSSHGVTCLISRSAVLYPVIGGTVPINPGNFVPTINLLSSSIWVGLPLDADNNPYIYLQASDVIQCEYSIALGSGSQIDIEVIGADF